MKQTNFRIYFCYLLDVVLNHKRNFFLLFSFQRNIQNYKIYTEGKLISARFSATKIYTMKQARS